MLSRILWAVGAIVVVVAVFKVIPADPNGFWNWTKDAGNSVNEKTGQVADKIKTEVNKLEPPDNFIPKTKSKKKGK